MIQTLNSHYEVILEIKRFRKCRKITTQKLYPLSFRISLSKRTKNRKPEIFLITNELRYV